MQESKVNRPLPSFRKDVVLYHGPDDSDGSPTYSLYDPVAAKYYKILWQESLIFHHYAAGMDAKTLADVLRQKTTMQATPEDIEMFFVQLGNFGLLNVHHGSEYYENVKKRTTQGWLLWLVYNYLYLKLPILNPDKFLERTLKYVVFLGSRTAIMCYLFLAMFGFYLIFSQWDVFINTFTYFFNMEGALYYAIGITLTKLVHEFSHAYVAKRYNVYVSSMGIAFIVLWPVLYTDVTEGWRLKSRKERLLISLAGVASELVLACFAIVGWSFSSPGVFQSLCYVLATTSLLATLAVNLNPAVRFDGYYLLSDLCGIDNLQSRSYEVTRWKYFDWLFGVKLPQPETKLYNKHIFFMCAYTVYSSIYRIFLYTAIAFLVYQEFTKALGILLFVAEVIIFMVWPVWTELKTLYNMRSLITLNRRLVGTLTVLTVAGGYFFLPWPHQIKTYGVVVPVREQILWAPKSGIIKELPVRRGQKVVKGQVIVVIESPSLQKAIQEAELDKERARTKIMELTAQDMTTQYLALAEHERIMAENKAAKLHGALIQLSLVAEFNGQLYSWNKDLSVNQSVSEGTILGKIGDFSTYIVKAYAAESQLNDFSVGQPATFRLDNPLTFVKGKVLSIAPFSSVTLDYPSLGSINAGPLPVVVKEEGQHLLTESYFEITIELEDPNHELSQFVRTGQKGEVSVTGPWVSFATELIRTVAPALIRESSL